jgi:galactonate dehydratase
MTKRRDFLKEAAAALALPMLPAWARSSVPAEKRPTGLKITGLKTYIVNAGRINLVLVKISTNEGITGLGEGSVTSKEATIAEAIKEHERFLLGQDPTRIEYLWQGMYRYPRWRGGPVLNSAISAVEIALWDILGKSLNVPVYKLLGGACRDEIRMYSHCINTSSPQELAQCALALKERGYTAVKFTPFLPREEIDGKRILDPHWAARDTVARVKAVREACGEDFDIAIDVHARTTPAMALDLAERIAEYRPFFLEEPVQSEDVQALQWLSERVKVPLATGERLFTKHGFAEIVEKHLVNFIQPDVVHAGGILELRKISAMAEAHYIDVMPHNPQGAVSTMASLHLNACTHNCVIQEHLERPEAPWLQELFHGEGAKIKNGYAALPEKPGIGLELNEKVAAAHPYQPITRPHFVWEDGSIADH